MKIMAKKSVSVVLALVLCLSLIFGIKVPASADNVDYVYSGEYIYNWGTRGETATFLSQNAESFYEDNNVTYEYLSSLSGSSSESGVPSSALYKQLHNLMESNQDYETSYNATKELFRYTDCQNNGGKISSFYSGIGIGPGWDGSWNREHTWPNSKGDKAGNGENDLMMLRPTSTSENSSRGNKAYGQSSSYYDPNSESNGKYDLRGDVARIVLYVYVRWECTNTGSGYNPNGIFGTDGVFESKQVLLDWMEADPVDTWELGRNDSAESILGTRNVFVDYPELAFVLFDEEIPADYTTPSGSAEGNSYTLTAQSNNTAWGTVSVSGKTINATPKTGYEVSGYEILSGTATVTRNGNAFSVVAESDVSIQINFAPRTQKTVKFSQDGVINSQTVYTGDQITLPAYSGAVPEGNNFVGWVENTVDETANMPSFYSVGSKYTVTSDVTLYALFSKNVTDGGASSNVFEKYSGTLVEGDYVITYYNNDLGAMNTSKNGGKNRLDYTVVTDNDRTITAIDSNIVWRIAKTDDGYWTIYNATVSKYVANSGTGNNAVLVDAVGNTTKWTATGNDTYEFQSLGNSRYLRRNGTFGFATYSKSTGGTLTLYKRVSGTIYYFTSTTQSICTHENAYKVEEIKATCTQSGFTDGQYCPDCEEYISGHEVIEAAHKYSSECDICCDICTEERNVYTVHTLGEDFICTICGEVLREYSVADVNNDGKINNRDYVIIMRYLNGWKVDIAVNAADVNSDGKLDNKDIVTLMQYLNGWNTIL